MDFLNNMEGAIIKSMILILAIIFAAQSVSAEAAIAYNWNGTHLIVNITSSQGVGSAQVKLNISSDLTVGSVSLTGFMADATHMQSGTEHRWFQLAANGNSNGVLLVPLACSGGGSYEVKLIDVNLKDVNNSSISVSPSMPLSKTINCGGQEISIQLNQGWNLVSLPITPKNTSIKSVLASVEGKYTKVGAWVNGAGKHYIPGFPFNTLTSIDEEMGFWIKMNQQGTLTVEGSTPADRQIPLQTGWNLVGYLSANKTLPLASALSSISGKYTKVGAWINGAGKHYIPGFPFNTLINMSEGYGYWIKMNASDILEY